MLQLVNIHSNNYLNHPQYTLSIRDVVVLKKIIDYLGQDYMKKCLKLYKKLILKLKIPS